jgi:hypothetical protein
VTRVVATSAGALAVALTTPAVAPGETLRPTRTDDPVPRMCTRDDCSLREAVLQAKRSKGPDEIVLRSGRTYELTRVASGDAGGRRGELFIRGDVRIHPTGKTRARISGESIRLLFRSRSRGGTARFTRLSLVGGESGTIDSWGAVVLAHSSVAGSGGIGVEAGGVVLNRSVVRGHEATGVDSYLGGTFLRSRIIDNGHGGAYICRKFVMKDSLIEGNTGGWQQAALQFGDYDTSSPGCSGTPPYRIVRSRIVGNPSDEFDSGGGIAASQYSSGGVIRRSVVARNAGDRGGIEADRVRIIGTRVAGNVGDPFEGAGGITAYDARIVRSTVVGNEGRIGGMLLGLSTVRSSTIADNHATRNGGGINVDDGVAVLNSTIADNTADMSGGGLFANGDVSLRSASVAYNEADVDQTGGESGGGVFLRSDVDAEFTATNSLMALNSVGSTTQDCVGPFDAANHNLVSALDPMCMGLGHASNLVRPDPGLGPLAANGGPTTTIRLVRASPAIGAAAQRTSPRVDQRGVRRDRRPDIGAFERR